MPHPTSPLSSLLRPPRQLYLSETERRRENLWRVYRMINALSLANEGLRKSSLTCEHNASVSQGIKQGEISRVNQYLAEVMGRFQELKNIADYRTPLGLRTFCELFIVILPVIFGPHYAHYAKTSQVMGYVLAVLYSVVLVGLFNVQTDLEDPFDGGEEENTDDINLNVWDDDMDVAMLPWAHKSLIDYYNIPKAL